MEQVDVGLLLSGAQQQQLQYFHSSASHKGLDIEYQNVPAGVNNVQDRVQFEADKQAVYRYFNLADLQTVGHC